jgi:alpha-1,3-rhamnosyl/mannosyltransferase
LGRKLKIVVNAIPAANPVTGIGRYVLELYAAIREVGGSEVDVRFFDGRGAAARPPQGPASVAAFSRLGRIYWSLPLALSLPVRLAVHAARELVFRRASEGADIYHETAFFPFRPRAGTRIVQTVHDLSLQRHPEWHPRERVAYSRRYFDARLGWASRILCVSEFTRRELAAYDARAAERASVTPLAADARFVPPGDDERRRVRERYALPQRYLLFVGSGDPRKNMAVLRELARRGRVPCELVCAGWSGWASEGDGAGVRALGYVPDADLPALYAEATAFVFPSLYEGFGLPVLEAMACGCPVVVPRAHAMPELVADAGAYYGAPDDVGGLERTLADVAADEGRRRAMSRAGLERARAFDWRSTARRTLAAFDAALSAGDPGRR